MTKDGFDEFGNPVGKAFDLGGVDDERLRGEKILLYVAYNPNMLQKALGENYEWHLAQRAVAERNLQMDIVFAPGGSKCSLNEQIITQYSQLWYVTDLKPSLKKPQVKMIGEYVKNGNGLLIWADNEPFFADANLLAQEIIGTHFSGNKYGNQVLTPGTTLAPGHFIEHPLTQGVNNLYEGITICTIAPAEDLTILAQSHDSQFCMACFERGNQRVVLDTGFTKLARGAFYKTAGTARYFRNIAFWLAHGARNLVYQSFTPGRERLAVINPNAASERYKYTVTQPTTLGYVLHWEGSATLGLVIQDPQGRTVYDQASATAPVRFDLAANIPGDYVCWVKGVNVPRANFPYVLTLVLHKGAPTAKPAVIASPRPAAAQAASHPAAPAVSAASKHLPVFVVIDSSSQASDLAPNLDLGLRTLLDRLRSRRSSVVAPQFELILADDAGKVAIPLSEAARLSLPAIVRRGKCGLDLALNNLLAHLSRLPGDQKPLVIIVLASPPDGDWGGAADRLRALAAQGKANVFVLGVGGYADSAVLKRLTPSTPLVLPVLTQMYIQQTFEWLYQIADVIMSGIESGSSGQRKNVPPPPACLQALP